MGRPPPPFVGKNSQIIPYFFFERFPYFSFIFFDTHVRKGKFSPLFLRILQKYSYEVENVNVRFSDGLCHIPERKWGHSPKVLLSHLTYMKCYIRQLGFQKLLKYKYISKKIIAIIIIILTAFSIE